MRERLPPAGDGEIEVGGGELLGEEDDLAGVVVEVANDFEDGFEDGGVAGEAGGLGVDDGEKAVGGDGGDDVGGVVEGAVEAGEGFGGRDGERGVEFGVALADVGLVVDAVEDPLAEVAFEVNEEIEDGVFVVAGVVTDLFVGELVEAAGDGLLQVFETRGGAGEEVVGDGVLRGRRDASRGGHDCHSKRVDCGRG